MGRLFVTVLNMSIGASFCILAVILLRLILKLAPKVFSYLLWAAVLVRLVCPVLPEANFGLMPDIELVEEYTPMSKDMAYRRYLMRMIWQMVLPAESRQADKSDDGSVVGTDSDAGMKAEVASADGEEVVTLMPEVVNTEDLPTEDFPIEYPPAEKIFLWGAAVRLSAGKLRVLAAVWALIGLGLAVYAVVGYIHFMRHVDKKKVTTPFVAGLIHPAIYLPDGLGDVPKQLVQEHERIHISRKDHLIKPFAFLVCCIHWFNPLVWTAFFLMERDMEASCDEAVIRRIGYDRRKDYANTLLGLSQSRGWRAGYPIAFGENHVKNRIKGVVKMKKAGIGVTVLATVFVVAAAVVLLVNRTGENGSETSVGEGANGGKAEFIDGSEDLAENLTLPPKEEQTGITNLPEEQAEDSTPEPGESGETVSIPDIKIDEYYLYEDLTDDDGQTPGESFTSENQETIMNYDPGRARDQYEVLLLPQPEGGFDSIGILFSYPVEGARISDGFGGRVHPASGDMVYHLGIDFAAEEGTPIVAAADGTVVKTDFDADCGNYMIILHENGDATYYFHCKEILAEEGDQVKRGDQIATVGKTGRATGSFVHFAVSRDGKYVEPEFVENEEGN